MICPSCHKENDFYLAETTTYDVLVYSFNEYDEPVVSARADTTYGIGDTRLICYQCQNEYPRNFEIEWE